MPATKLVKKLTLAQEFNFNVIDWFQTVKVEQISIFFQELFQCLLQEARVTIKFVRLVSFESRNIYHFFCTTPVVVSHFIEQNVSEVTVSVFHDFHLLIQHVEVRRS